MKTLLPLLLSLLLPFYLFGQHVVLANDAVNVFYEFIDNPVSVAVENYKDVTVETDNGSIIKSSPGKYIIQNAKPGTATITLKRKTGNQLIEVGKKKFRVKALPVPIARVAGKTGGKINMNLLKVQMGMVAYFDCGEGMKFKITRFNITIARNKTIVLNHSNMGNTFDDVIKSAFQKLTAGDIVLFDDIYCIGLNNQERRLESIEFTILP